MRTTKNVLNKKILILGLLMMVSWSRGLPSTLNAQTAREAEPAVAFPQEGPVWETIGDANPTIDEVEKVFSEISTVGEHLAAWQGGQISGSWYTSSIKNKFGFRNHFQGIQRLRDSNYLVISGSNANAPVSNLFIVKMASRRESGSWESNLMADDRPPLEDVLVKRIDIDSTMWHVGGLSLLGDILAVPIYGGKPLHGKILFYRLTNPEEPERLAIEIGRPGRKAYVTALTRLPNDHFLLAVMSGRDGLPRRLDFYLSISDHILEGFENNHLSWLVSGVQARNGQGKNFSDFQSLNFLRQTDGRLYLVGMHNTALHLRILFGRNYADLYEVVFPEQTLRVQQPELGTPVITKVANRRFHCSDGYCNMDAAAGIYIHASGTLSVYAAAFWLKGKLLKFTSFRSKPNTGD